MANKAPPETRPQAVSSNFFKTHPFYLRIKSAALILDEAAQKTIVQKIYSGSSLLLLLGDFSAELSQHLGSVLQAFGFGILGPFDF